MMFKHWTKDSEMPSLDARQPRNSDSRLWQSDWSKINFGQERRHERENRQSDRKREKNREAGNGGVVETTAEAHKKPSSTIGS